MELVYDPYKDSLNNILDSNIDDIVISIIDINPCLLKRTISGTQIEMPLNIALLLKLFSEAISGRNKNSSSFVKRNILLTLLSSIMLKEPSNLLFRLFGNYG